MVRKLPQYGAGAGVRGDGAGTREAAMEVVRNIWTPERYYGGKMDRV